MAVSARFSRNAEAVLLLVSSFSARCRTSWVLVIPEAMNPPRSNFFDLLRCGPSYTSLPVEKQRLSRILCGFLHWGVEKGQEIRGFEVILDCKGHAQPLWSSPTFVWGCHNGDRRLFV